MRNPQRSSWHREMSDDEVKLHLGKAIFQGEIDRAYFDCLRGGQTFDEAVRESIRYGALSLLVNRAVELRGVTTEDFASEVWSRLRPSVTGFHRIDDPDQRRRAVVSTVARLLLNVGFAYWKSIKGEFS